MNVEQLKKEVVIPTLYYLGLYSESAVNLILGTIAQESRMGHYIKQIGRGSALGICQMEPETEKDIQDNFLAYRPELAQLVDNLLAPQPDRTSQLKTNLAYAVAMCRIHYLRNPKPLPGPEDVHGLGGYWKYGYNTIHGKGTIEEFEHNYKKFGLGK